MTNRKEFLKALGAAVALPMVAKADEREVIDFRDPFYAEQLEENAKWIVGFWATAHVMYDISIERIEKQRIWYWSDYEPEQAKMLCKGLLLAKQHLGEHCLIFNHEDKTYSFKTKSGRTIDVKMKFNDVPILMRFWKPHTNTLMDMLWEMSKEWKNILKENIVSYMQKHDCGYTVVDMKGNTEWSIENLF